MALYYDRTLLWILSGSTFLVKVVKYADHSSMPRLLQQDERLVYVRRCTSTLDGTQVVIPY